MRVLIFGGPENKSSDNVGMITNIISNVDELHGPIETIMASEDWADGCWEPACAYAETNSLDYHSVVPPASSSIMRQHALQRNFVNNGRIDFAVAINRGAGLGMNALSIHMLHMLREHYIPVLMVNPYTGSQTLMGKRYPIEWINEA